MIESSPDRPVERRRPRRVGHKGAADIERGNTLASFDAALRHGVDMIELDVLSEHADGRGRLLVALPAPEDLIELRGAGRDRVPRTVETFAPWFKLAGQRRVTTTADLDAAAVEDVLLSIYRPMRSRPPKGMKLTFSLDLLLFETGTRDFSRVHETR